MMKPHWLITLSLTLLLAMACSKDEEATEEANDTGEPATPPTEDTAPTTPSEPENMEPSSDTSTDTSFPIPNPTADLPVGKQRDWTYGTGQQADLDRVYLNQAVNVLTNAFGLPTSTQAQGQYGIWFYDQMKVDYMGTNYSKINVIIQQGRVVQLTIDPRSAALGGSPSTPGAPKGTIDPTTGQPFN